jgi:hypothetical protein
VAKLGPGTRAKEESDQAWNLTTFPVKKGGGRVTGYFCAILG